MKKQGLRQDLEATQCNTNIFNYSNIGISSPKYSIFEYEYYVSSERIYSIFIFGHLDFMNVYLVHIRDGFG